LVRAIKLLLLAPIHKARAELNAQEPSYWTNRAASYMALKKFKPAVDDCQQALFILNPQMPPNKPALVKALLRLARCQYALGSLSAAASSLARILGLEPGNAQAKALQQKITVLQGHVKNFEKAYGQKDWGMARLALEKCQQALDAEGGGVDSIPAEWRVWKVELELARGNWDGASIGANEALRASPNSPDALALRGLVLFLTGKLSQALTHVNSALRYDPGHDRAGSLRKRVKDVERLKEEGNVAFKTNNLLEAMDKYGEALEVRGTYLF
jgi:DnaJ family protein C protein 7